MRLVSPLGKAGRALTSPACSARPYWPHRGGDQSASSGLQALGENFRDSPGHLVTECRVGSTPCPYRSRVEFEGLHRAGGHGAEGPYERREQPRPAHQLTDADGVDRYPALPGNVDVHCYIAGLNQPEAGGVTSVLEEPVPGREGDVRSGPGEHG